MAAVPLGPGQPRVGQGPASPQHLSGARARHGLATRPCPVEKEDLLGVAMKKHKSVEQVGRGRNGSRERR